MAKSAIETLHASYTAGKLRVLVGAGTSVQSGFPGWDKLCIGLLERYLSDKHEREVLVGHAEIERLARDLLDVLGRDAAADFVRLADPEKFELRLAQALYSDREIEDLPILSVHNQLAALARGAKNSRAILYTTNYDPLIELAHCYTEPALDFRSLRRAGVSAHGDDGAGHPLVQHVHGWVDPDGESGGTVVLTETHYLELQQQAQADPNQVLSRLLHDEGTLLIIGMSLADPNLRRLLYWRKRDELRSNSQKVYVVLKKRHPVLDGYLVEHWKLWKINIVLVDDYAELPGLLRDVQWGESEPPWTAASMDWVAQRIGDVLFHDTWQALAHRTLKALKDQIEVWFALPGEERVDLAVFAPIPGAWSGAPPTISTVATSRRQRTGDEARRHAEVRRLAVSRGAEQGVAGLAFGTGTTREVLDDGVGINLNFSPDMVEIWDLSGGYREWRSVLAIPVLDSPAWLPVAVVTITSSYATPFWARFTDDSGRYMAELEKMIRRAAKWLLVESHDAARPLGERYP